MPELPEVESMRRSLLKVSRGRKIKEVRVKSDPIVMKWDSAAQLINQLRGRKILNIERKGKYFWLQLSGGGYLLGHLGMTGFMKSFQSSEANPKAWKLELQMSLQERLVFYDPRRFGRLRYLKQNPRELAPISLLGFDPLEKWPRPQVFKTIFQKTKRSIKAVLLDQSLFAGVGNWLADEILFQSLISPHRLAGSLTDLDIRRLHRAVKKIIDRAVKVNANSDRFPASWLFHHRWAIKPGTIASGQKVVRETVAGRTTAWVPALQK